MPRSETLITHTPLFDAEGRSLEGVVLVTVLKCLVEDIEDGGATKITEFLSTTSYIRPLPGRVDPDAEVLPSA